MLLPTSNKPAPGSSRRAVFRAMPRSALLISVCAIMVAGTILLSAAQAQAPNFADPAFELLWDRTDGLVASGDVQRPYVWGPAPGESIDEPFTGIPGNSHLVQFFDKGRMEINDPTVDPADPFYVTNGRLAIELISGLAQTGLDSFENRGTAQINLASDADDPTAPTYGSFNGVSNIPGAPNERRSDDETGSVVRTAIDRQGVTQPWPSDHPDYGVRITHYEEETGHNIPDVFWDYLNQQTTIVQEGEIVEGPLFYPWFSVTGFPISEPYWSYVKVEGKYTDVLIQAYERRVLTFVPHLPTPFKVQMGNIGQHYYEWRYLNQAAPTPPPPGPIATPTSPNLPPKANLTIDGINYRASIIDINGTFCIISNRGNTPVSLRNWRLDSPKWGIVDTYRFEDSVTLAAGASIRVHSGIGQPTATDIYMHRPTVMWDGQNYDYAVLYDNYGRQVSDFFPAGDVGPPPTPEPTQGAGNPTPTTVKASPTTAPGAPTNTPQVPAPSDTKEPGVATATRTGQPTVSPTRTSTPGGPTATPTTTGGGNCSELMVNGDFEQEEVSWLQRTVQDDVPLILGDRPHNGDFGAYLADLDNVDDHLWQVVNIPANMSRVTLSYWRRVESEDSQTNPNDFMYLEIRDTNEGLLRSLDTINNTSTRDTWEQKTFTDLANFSGQSVQVHLRATSDVSSSTDFFADDFSLQACR